MPLSAPYVSAALESACRLIGTAQSGVRNDLLNREAYGIGQLIGEHLSYDQAEGTLISAAIAAGLDRHAARDTVRSGLQAGMKTPRTETAARPSQPRRTTSEMAADYYREAKPIAGTPAERYLRDVRMLPGPFPAGFRYHSHIYHKHEGCELPALVAPIMHVDALGQTVRAIHVTFLDPVTARKRGNPSKKMYGEVRGAAIWLSDFANHMAVVEGIEKGLAIQASTGIPTIVGLSASILPTLILPKGTSRITICADPNKAGERAAARAASLWTRDNVEVFVCYPPASGLDWDECDVDLIPEVVRNAKLWQPPRNTQTLSVVANNPSIEKETAEKPVIIVQGGSLSLNADAAQNILITAGIPIYRRGLQLVRPTARVFADAKSHDVETPVLEAVTTTWLRDQLCQVAKWKKWYAREKDYLPITPPADIADTILARLGEGFQTISGVTSTPVFRRDGSIATASGYDRVTGRYLFKPLAIKMPEQPTRDDAEKAIELLSELLEEFPFDDPTGCPAGASESVALSAILTPLARSAVEFVPMHISRAPMRGSGKSYLFDVMAAIACGTSCPIVQAGDIIAETEKRVGARAIMATSIISIDNVNGQLAGDLLCQMITQPIIGIRVLGESRIVDVTNSYSLFATGNNIRLAGDLTRRCLICLLDAKTERPEERNFIGDPLKKAIDNRSLYVSAVLTILRAHALAGYPGAEDLTPLAGFADWSRVVRGALVWLGRADPCVTISFARDEDPQRGERSDMIAAMSQMFGEGPNVAVTVLKMIEASKADDGLYDTEERREGRRRLRDALIPFERHGVVNSRSVGRWLNSFSGEIINGKRLSGKVSHNQKLWFVEVL